MDIDFSKGLVPAIVVDYKTNKTLETKTTWFYSRSRKELWNKGATSGHYQYIKEMYTDCDNDTLLIKVEQVGVPCHTGADTCFFNKII